MQHIGIVGCSAEGAALCFRTICAGSRNHPEVSMHTPPLAAYVEYLERGDLEGVAMLMLASAEKLARAGADFLICPDNTIHAAFPLVVERSPLPWLHIAEVVAEEAHARGFRRVGIAGTRWLVESDVYPRALEQHGIAWVRPALEDRALLDRVIMDELVPGMPTSTEALLAAIARLGDDGCDAVALACTELPLVITEANAPLPTLDSTRLLARAALARSRSA